MDNFITILCGVSVYILGQIFLKMFIDPVAELKRTISKVQYNMTFFAHLMYTDVSKEQDIEEVFGVVRALSAELLSSANLIPFYSFVHVIFGLPKIENIRKSSTNLIALGNWINRQGRDDRYVHIIKNSQELYENLDLNIDDKDKIDEKTIRALLGNND